MSSQYYSKRIPTRYRRQHYNRSKRPKTFHSEAAANKYAKENGIANFTLKNLRSEAAKEPKFRIIEQA